MRKLASLAGMAPVLMWSAAALADPDYGHGDRDPVNPYIDPQELQEAERLARESLDLMMESLQHMLDAIPQYELPEITPEGDIIIRRKDRGLELDEFDAPGDETSI